MRPRPLPNLCARTISTPVSRRLWRATKREKDETTRLEHGAAKEHLENGEELTQVGDGLGQGGVEGAVSVQEDAVDGRDDAEDEGD